MKDKWLTLSKRIVLLTFPVMGIGLIWDNNALIWGCIFLVFAVNSLMLIYTELELRKSRKQFEEVHVKFMELCDNFKKQKEEKAKIKIP